MSGCIRHCRNHVGMFFILSRLVVFCKRKIAYLVFLGSISYMVVFRMDGHDDLMENLADYSENRWSDILLELVTAGGHPILSNGLEFFLQSRSTQLWFLLLSFIDFLLFHTGGTAENREASWTEALQFLFQLALAPSSTPFATAQLSPWNRRYLLPALETIGMLYLSDKEIFYVTPLSYCLSSSSSLSKTQKHLKTGFIILETNFKLYAYTANALDIAILSLFTHLKTKFPNLVTGRKYLSCLGPELSTFYLDFRNSDERCLPECLFKRHSSKAYYRLFGGACPS
jgi:Transcription factor Tfb2